MNDTAVLGVQILTGVLVGALGFTIKLGFEAIQKNEDRINELEKDVSGLRERSKSIFQRLDSIEQKLDKLLDREV
ncbi:MAG: hypothetical protein Unbinned3806contig1000_28 [Prokaryotic dsDNA virus sp.]|nr:MAG: hypothetical protein Unbinned3806contig1000_28 [Prokaryotic dsDNA virus sp.]|tara:strand:- start:39327 stop:39551 length:225 start_codon:yes stop_codon:yes gene_type:complete